MLFDAESTSEFRLSPGAQLSPNRWDERSILRQQHLLKREHPTCTERIWLTKECGWKDSDRGGLAEWEQTHGKKKAKVCLDINRPSHGRTYPVRGDYFWFRRDPGQIATFDSTLAWFCSLIGAKKPST